MAILFFSLRGVPADEIEDVRQLLADNGIEFYETSAGTWGTSLPAIWLYRAEDLPAASELFDRYQTQRALTQRAHYQALKSSGEVLGFWRHNLTRPLRFLGLVILVGLVGFVSLKWLFDLGL
ncbi:DUF6164 family protein [Methylomonas sp. SURF-1]|uniref:DUF6164 family protein n=1 Tax=Methylomonas aurea TaxID=2952224 RepID=A0ABT1UHW3_9GAMM|nr:DUF6164 family protein [Methylomonas sp. SURF-1]MCQ8181823.1 DUF6164 family protein [Methylomonas sp. SURF-1]